MDTTVQNLLDGQANNHILPFFWQHGEDEATLREYMRVINECNCGAVCVESRPHPDFCGDKWWADMDVILDEARTRGMKVWILDDSHFPTGFANGALKNQPDSLCRQSVNYHSVNLPGGGNVSLNLKKYVKPMKALHNNPKWRFAMRFIIKVTRTFDDDQLLSVTAFGPNGEMVDMAPFMEGTQLRWQKPAGDWQLAVCVLSRNTGPHRDYINMLDADSCRLLIDAVYEPHFQHYGGDFGNTIAGFFSDEPELGNGVLYPSTNLLGTQQDLPWSAGLETVLEQRLGEGWRNRIPLLWKNDASADETAHVRYTYMDSLTQLVEKSFSWQVGDWCREHGVLYIGHIIEDDNQHARTGSSLGHYYRGLAGQDMSGIDDIGGQVLPQGEDEPRVGTLGALRPGSFYHYVLGKLGSSAAAIEPLKQGRAMCEIFGNYGWIEGVQLEKYLADHFLVRGINEYVPHAFSPKDYPDPDCPPHFYAHGHNPQYRHFGALMGYMNRVSDLVSGGKPVCPVAILYHAEAEWAGRAMMMEHPARRLYDRQIDYLFLPSDVFAQPEQYQAQTDTELIVNGCEFKVLVVPYAQYITKAFAESACRLHAAGFPVLFVDALPEGLCDSDDALPAELAGCPVIALDHLVQELDERGIPDIGLSPDNDRIRVLHYIAECERYLIVNEAATVYSGTITLPSKGTCHGYDAWHNRLLRLDSVPVNGGTTVTFTLEPRKSLVILFGDVNSDSPFMPDTTKKDWQPVALSPFTRALCKGIEYPVFGQAKPVQVPDQLAVELPAFSGYARYATTFEAADSRECMVEITDAQEGVEVFVNGQSAGIQVVPVFRYDVTPLVKPGSNELVIEVATTLARERAGSKNKGIIERLTFQKPTGGSGLTGQVTVSCR